MVASLNHLINRYSLTGRLVGDVALGAVMNSSRDFNLGRECVLETKLHPDTPAYNLQRACGTSLEAAWAISLKLHVGAMDIGIAGGVDTNSDAPIEVSRGLQRALIHASKEKNLTRKLKAFLSLRPKDLIPVVPNVNEPRTHLSMGDHCELMVKEWKISREDQDKLAFESHKNAASAYERGFYDDLVFPFQELNQDATLRPDTSLEKLSRLKPAFDLEGGTLTAGNSSPLTDGSSCVLLSNPNGASQLGLSPLAKMVDVEASAVDFVHGAGLLMAPTKAVAKLLSRNRWSFSDFDFFEIHEAFAGQVLCTLKAWESEDYCRNALGLRAPLGSLDRSKLNTVGGSVSLGHPFAATGTRIVGTLAKLLSQGGKKRGLISICTAGGMGIAAVLESV